MLHIPVCISLPSPRERKQKLERIQKWVLQIAGLRVKKQHSESNYRYWFTAPIINYLTLCFLFQKVSDSWSNHVVWAVAYFYCLFLLWLWERERESHILLSTTKPKDNCTLWLIQEKKQVLFKSMVCTATLTGKKIGMSVKEGDVHRGFLATHMVSQEDPSAGS